MEAIRTEKVTDTRVWQVSNGSVGGVMRPWMVKINGHTAGFFDVARFQPDPLVFCTRSAARAFASRVMIVGIYRDVCSAQACYAVAQ